MKIVIVSIIAIILGSFIWLKVAAYNGMNEQQVCGTNAAGTICTTDQHTMFEIPGKNGAPVYLNSAPPELQHKLPIVPAETPKFKQNGN